MENSGDPEGTAGPSDGPIKHDTKGAIQLPPTSQTSVATVDEPSKWIVFTYTHRGWEYLHYQEYTDAKFVYDNITQTHKLLALVYHER